MKNLLKAEFFYLTKSIKYYVFIGIILACSIATFVSKNSFIPTALQFVSIVFCAVMVLEFSHKDFKNKTMKNYVGCGIPLWKVYFAKLIVCFVAVLIILLISNISSEVSQVACGLKEAASVNFAAIILDIVVDMIEATVVFFFCSFISSGVVSILIAVVYTVIAPLILTFVNIGFLEPIKPFLSFNITGELSQNSLSEAMSGSTDAVASLEPSAVTPEILLHLCVPIIIAIALSCLGAFFYSKREVK